MVIKIKDYSNWKVHRDFENDSPWVDPNRPWVKNRPATIPKTIKYDPIPMPELIKLAIEKFPNNVCVYDKVADKKYTYRELGHYAARVANALHELGVRKGDGVAIMSANCAEFFFCCLGIQLTGAMAIPINAMLKESDVTHIVRTSGNVKAIFVHSANYRTVKKAAKVVEIKNMILLGSEEAKENTITFSDFIKDKAPNAPEVDLDPLNDVAALMYTGGTTGLPKGVMLTHDNLVSVFARALYGRDTPKEELEADMGTDTLLAIMPLCHVMGFLLINVMSARAAMSVMFPFTPAETLEAIEYYKIKQFIAVPVMYQMIINHPDFTERDLSNLESAISGSAALAPELSKKWVEVTGFKVGQGYGMTETSGAGNQPADWMPKGIISESVSQPIVDLDLKVVNPDTLEELKPNEVGELMFKGPIVMKGYWKNKDATDEDIVDGWLRTGDLGRMDEDGYFYIEGRTKDMVKYKGYKVMAKEVEEKLMENPAILEAGVVGIPDPNIGETIKAFVVLRKEYKDKNITEQDIIGWAKDKLAGYKYPRHVEFIKALPRTPVGKIFRRKLREMEIEKQQS